jgi:hypothetical protein
LRNSPLNEGYELILPHEHSDELFSSKEFFRDKCDVIVVEASCPKLGVGIEVGWADAYGVPIITMYKKGCKLSASLKPMSREVIEYSSIDEMVSKLGAALGRI